VVLEGEMDIMATVDDMREQRRRLTNANLTEIVYQTYGHMDFVSRGGMQGLGVGPMVQRVHLNTTAYCVCYCQ
jgi:hypothetical protein